MPLTFGQPSSWIAAVNEATPQNTQTDFNLSFAPAIFNLPA